MDKNPAYTIPFNKPFLVGKELAYISQCLLKGHASGNGHFTRLCQQLMEERFQAKKVLLTTSCTSALEMIALLCSIGKDDEVIVPAYTFVSTANAFYQRGARPVFVDIRLDTLNIDERQIEEKITSRTKAIVPVHYGGVGAEMDSIMAIARKRGVTVIEDAAQAINARYHGRFLGTIGDFGAYSFHETKNIICGEGGAIVINDERYIKRAEIMWEKGTNRLRFFRGEVDKYTWVDVGSSYLPSDLLAAFLFAQLEEMERISQRRKELFERYYELLSPLSERGLITLPARQFLEESNYHLFYFLCENVKQRDALRRQLNAAGICAIFHYVPLHLSPVGKALGYKPGNFPITESVSDRLLRLPMYYDLKPTDQQYIAEKIKAFFRL